MPICLGGDNPPVAALEDASNELLVACLAEHVADSAVWQAECRGDPRDGPCRPLVQLVPHPPDDDNLRCAEAREIGVPSEHDAACSTSCLRFLPDIQAQLVGLLDDDTIRDELRDDARDSVASHDDDVRQPRDRDARAKLLEIGLRADAIVPASVPTPKQRREDDRQRRIFARDMNSHHLGGHRCALRNLLLERDLRTYCIPNRR